MSNPQETTQRGKVKWGPDRRR